jgi:hypothetical protein
MNTRTYSRFSSTVSTWKKPSGEDPGGLGAQELPPGRACATRSRIDTRGTLDLPDGGRRDRHAEFRHFAVDPAVSPQRILLRQPDDKAGLRQLLVSYLLAAGLRCQASSVAGATAKTSVQRLQGRSRARSCATTGSPTRRGVCWPAARRCRRPRGWYRPRRPAGSPGGAGRPVRRPHRSSGRRGHQPRPGSRAATSTSSTASTSSPPSRPARGPG